jgi:general secretion pathway protein G
LDKEILLRKMNSIFWKVASLLLAITIYTVIVTIYNPVLASTIQTELSKAELYFFSVSNSITFFRLDVGRYPMAHEGLSALFKEPNDINSEVWLGPYLKNGRLKDLWGQDYQYTYPGIHNKNSFDLFSLGQDGVEGTVDDINNWDDNSSWRKYYRKNKPWKEYWYEYYLVIISLGFGLLVGILLEIIRIIKLKKRN